MSPAVTIPVGEHSIKPIHRRDDGTITVAQVIRCDSVGQAAGEVTRVGSRWIASTPRFGTLTGSDGYPIEFADLDAAVARVARSARQKRWQK